MAIYPGDMMDDPNDMLRGGPDADVLWGGMGDDTLQGAGGDDRLIGGPGADALNGGPGMDVASYTMSPAGVNIDYSFIFGAEEDDKPRVFGGDAEGDELTSIEAIWASAFADDLTGGHGVDTFFGNGGDDMISGGMGNDMLHGGGDNDLVGGGDGDDMLHGDGGGDTLNGDMGDDMLYGGLGDDALNGGDGDDMLEGGPGADMLDGGLHSAKSNGGDTASYTMSPEAVKINLYATLITNPDLDNPAQVVAAGGDAEGDDYEEIENVRGSAHNDILVGGAAGAYDGSGERNIIWGQQGNDTIIGLEEFGSFDVTSKDMFYGGKGDDTIKGGGGDDKLYGQLGDDNLQGGSGDDTLDGGPGMDMLYGGTVDGNGRHEDDNGDMGDTADYSKSKMGIEIDLSATTPTGESMPTAKGGDAEGDMLEGIENITGTDYTDLLYGDDGANHLKGGKGDDWDDPNTGRVTEGGLFGLGGKDTLDGGSGNDWLDASESTEVVKIIGGTGHDMLIGGAGDDMKVIAVTAAPDATPAVLGVLGVDAGLYGGAGNDTLVGGAGGDLLDGGNGNDTADYSDSPVPTEGTDTLTIDLRAAGFDHDVVAATPNVNADGEHAEGDTLKSIENVIGSEDGENVLTGDNKANMLKGGDGSSTAAAVDESNFTTGVEATFDDRLMGGGGRDTLEAGEGSDYLMGGAGADTFFFDEQNDGDENYIADFTKSEGDKIDLSELGLSEHELRTILRVNTERKGDVIQVDLMDDDGGMLYVNMADDFSTLTVDDFII